MSERKLEAIRDEILENINIIIIRRNMPICVLDRIKPIQNSMFCITLVCIVAYVLENPDVTILYQSESQNNIASLYTPDLYTMYRLLYILYCYRKLFKDFSLT